MQHTMQSIVNWLDSSPTARVVFTTVLLAIVSALVNFMLRLDTPEQWEQLKKDHPRMAGAIALLRAVGIDPVKMLNAVASLVRGRWSK